MKKLIRSDIAQAEKIVINTLYNNLGRNYDAVKSFDNWAFLWSRGLYEILFGRMNEKI